MVEPCSTVSAISAIAPAGSALLTSPVLITGVAVAAAGMAANSMYETHCRHKLEEASKKISSEENIALHKLDLESQERLVNAHPDLYKLKEEKMHEREMERMRLVHLAEEREKDRQLVRELANLNVTGVTVNRAIDRLFENFDNPSLGSSPSQA